MREGVTNQKNDGYGRRIRGHDGQPQQRGDGDLERT